MSNRLKRAQRREKTTFLIRRLLVVVLAVLLIGMLVKGISWAVIKYDNYRMQTISAEHIVIENRLTAKVMAIHDETVVYAVESGSFENLVKDGERVRKGDTAGYLRHQGQRHTITIPCTGIYTSQVDGLEGILNSVKLKAITDEVFSYQLQTPTNKNYYAKGNAVFKVVNNLTSTRLLIRTEDDRAPRMFNERDWLYINDFSRMDIKAVVKDYHQEGDCTYALLELNNYYDHYVQTRITNVDLVFSPTEGTKIPLKSIIEKDNKKGVYVIRGETIIFREISILQCTDNSVIVKGLADNDLIVGNPGYIKGSKI